jgi:hypothetical protein
MLMLRSYKAVRPVEEKWIKTSGEKTRPAIGGRVCRKTPSKQKRLLKVSLNRGHVEKANLTRQPRLEGYQWNEKGIAGAGVRTSDPLRPIDDSKPLR